ncbi:MAG: hypothetical protein RL701_3584, partial [Pseudomonadota bacterium]
EQHARGPDLKAATVQGQQQPAHQRLQHEQETRTEYDEDAQSCLRARLPLKHGRIGYDSRPTCNLPLRALPNGVRRLLAKRETDRRTVQDTHLARVYFVGKRQRVVSRIVHVTLDLELVAVLHA